MLTFSTGSFDKVQVLQEAYKTLTGLMLSQKLCTHTHTHTPDKRAWFHGATGASTTKFGHTELNPLLGIRLPAVDCQHARLRT